jgi:hypothetical protein
MHLLADQVLGLQILSMGQQIEVDFRQLVHVFVHDRRGHQQNIGSERCVERDVSVLLGQRRGTRGAGIVDRVSHRRGRLVHQRETRLRKLRRPLHGVDMTREASKWPKLIRDAGSH